MPGFRLIPNQPTGEGSEPTVAQVLDGECPCCNDKDCFVDDDEDCVDGPEILDPEDVVVGAACQYIQPVYRVHGEPVLPPIIRAAIITEVHHAPLGLITVATVGGGGGGRESGGAAMHVPYCDDRDENGNPIPGTWRWLQK